MIILWSRSDHGQQDAPPPANRVMNNPTEAWKYETIIQIDHHREGIPTWVKNIVKAKNDGTVVPGRNPFYNHYVPYSRIKDCLIARWTGKTREQIVWDCDYLRAQFGLTKRKCDPALNRYNFHDYVNSIFQFVCDWSENIFDAPSQGDRRGRQIDLPTRATANVSVNLNWRLQNAAQKLHQVTGVNVGDFHDVPLQGNNAVIQKQILWNPMTTEDGEMEN